MLSRAGKTDSLSLPDSKRFDRLVSSRKPFGLETTFKGKAAKRAGDVLVYQNGGTGYIARSSITTGTAPHRQVEGLRWLRRSRDRQQRHLSAQDHQHAIRRASQARISSETYLCIGPFDSKSQAESVLSYLSCRLTRLLILLHKPSQHTTRKVYTFVPTQDWTRRWTDEDLYAKYGLTASEIAFIEKIVRPMDTSDEASDDDE